MIIVLFISHFFLLLRISSLVFEKKHTQLLRNFKLMIEIVIMMKFNKRPPRYESVDNNGFWLFKYTVYAYRVQRIAYVFYE